MIHRAARGTLWPVRCDAKLLGSGKTTLVPDCRETATFPLAAGRCDRSRPVTSSHHACAACLSSKWLACLRSGACHPNSGPFLQRLGSHSHSQRKPRALTPSLSLRNRDQQQGLAGLILRPVLRAQRKRHTLSSHSHSQSQLQSPLRFASTVAAASFRPMHSHISKAGAARHFGYCYGNGRTQLSQKQSSDVSVKSPSPGGGGGGKAGRSRMQERERLADLKRSAPVMDGPSAPDEGVIASEHQGHNTGIMVQNSLTKHMHKKEPLVLRNQSVATWYSCGPTVYDSPHIGHGSCYVRFDILRRILKEFYDVNVVQVLGITDIDSKIIQRSHEEGLEFYKLTKKYETEFFRGMEKLQVLPATVNPRVTDHMPQIISFIQRVIKNGYAYPTDSGNVYFDVEAYGAHRYKKLASHYMEPGKRDPEKKKPEDFALWKAHKPDEPWWHSPWGQGRGRPGWHIECSVMSSEIFGENLDIHTGGRDLAFPHHNNEIAQCEACFNSNHWTRYFLHSGHLFRKSDPNKMSKSLKNVVTIDDFLESYTANHFRVLCLMSKYNHDIEYSEETVRHAVKICKQLASFLNDADAYVKGHLMAREISEEALMHKLAETQTHFLRAIADDFDTKRGLDAIMELVRAANMAIGDKQHQQHMSVPRIPGAIAGVATYIDRILQSLGVKFQSRKDADASRSTQALSSTMDTLINLRSEVRQWALETPLEDDLRGPEVIQQGTDKPKPRRLMYKALHRRSELLQKCDNVRQDLIQAGVQIKVGQRMDAIL